MTEGIYSRTNRKKPLAKTGRIHSRRGGYCLHKGKNTSGKAPIYSLRERVSGLRESSIQPNYLRHKEKKTTVQKTDAPTLKNLRQEKDVLRSGNIKLY